MIWLLAPALGALFCFAIAPFDQWWAAVISIGGFYFLLCNGKYHPGWVAWLYGLGKFGLGASWVYVSIHVYGNAPVPLAILLVVLFTMLSACLFCWPLGWLYGRLASAGHRHHAIWINGLLFVGLWGLLDWTATWLFSGFPWLYVGNGLIDTWFSGWTPVLGVLGTSLLFVLLTTCIVGVWQRRSRPLHVAIMTSVGCLTLFVGAWLQQQTWVEAQSKHSVALVQGNLDQATKWQSDQAMPNVQRHLALSATHWSTDLLVWPEAAITLYPQQAQQLIADLAQQALASNTAFIFGIPGVEQAGDGYVYKNLAMGVGLAKGRFAKHHLVPFGEYVPFESLLRGLIDFFDLPMSSSSGGRANQPNIKTHLGEVAMAICYEVAYPESMRRKSGSAAVLLTISNDTWFGGSLGPLQHMQIAQVRALENGRWLLRATNSGITGIVDHRGQIQARLEQFQAQTLAGEWTVMTGFTPFVKYGHLPFFVLVGLCLLPAIGGIFAARINTNN